MFQLTLGDITGSEPIAKAGCWNTFSLFKKWIFLTPGTAARLIVGKLAEASPSCGTFKSFSFYLQSRAAFVFNSLK